MVQKRAAAFGQGDRESKVVKQFASGFVAQSAATEAAKAEQRDWDRSAVLSAGESDPQAQIYEKYAANANTNAEGQSSRRGLGAGGGGGGGGGSLRRGVAFVGAGGTPAATPTLVGTGMGAGAPAQPAYAPTPAASAALPGGWVAATDPASGATYYVHPPTGRTQWEAPTAPAAPALPAGWVATTDPATGATYYANPATGESSWERPAEKVAEPPPLPPDDPPPLPDEPPPPLPPGPAPPLPPDRQLAAEWSRSDSGAAVRSGTPLHPAPPAARVAGRHSLLYLCAGARVPRARRDG